jgi:hypothetical protein
MLLENDIPPDANSSVAQTIVQQHESIKRKTIEQRRLHQRKFAE